MNEKTCILTVSSLSPKGEGIAFYEGKEVYIEGALPFEEVEVLVGDSFVEGSKRCPGKLIKIIKRSKDRADDNQPKLLGDACVWGALKYETTLKLKQDLIQDALKSIGVKLAVPEIEKSDFNLIVRNKSIRYFGTQNNEVICGFYKSRSHEVTPAAKCILEPQWFLDFSKKLCDLANKYHICVYDEILHIGYLRALLLRDCADEKLAMIISTQELTSEFIEEYKALARDFNIKALFLCLNPYEGNALVKGKIISLGEDLYIKESFFDCDFKVGPTTFLQVNKSIAKKIYDEAVAFCNGVSDKDCALDLCCGIGTMTIGLSRHFKKVIGIEIVEDSVKAANNNAKDNHVCNVEFIAGDLKKKIRSCVNSSVKAVIADPSRQGLGQSVCDALKSLPSGCRISLIFCALPALKRDVLSLLKNGFDIDGVKGFDMFPYTNHVETLVLMHKR